MRKRREPRRIFQFEVRVDLRNFEQRATKSENPRETGLFAWKIARLKLRSKQLDWMLRTNPSIFMDPKIFRQTEQTWGRDGESGDNEITADYYSSDLTLCRRGIRRIPRECLKLAQNFIVSFRVCLIQWHILLECYMLMLWMFMAISNMCFHRRPK